MTDDELDLLASAYVDGEATPEEVALVEADPELLARVEIFRSVQVDEPAPAAPAVADRHLATAMAEFEMRTAARSESTAGAPVAGDVHIDVEDESDVAPVVDLRDRARGSRSERRREASAPARRRSPFQSVPSWLPAAAAFVIIGGGLVFALGRDGDDDATETASVAADTDATDDSAEGESMRTEAAGADLDDDSADDSAADESSDEAMEAAQLATEDSADSAAAPASGANEESDEEAADDAEREFVELVPVLFFEQIPDAESLADLAVPEPEVDLGRSRCGFELLAPSLGEPRGFVPAQVVGEPAELFLFEQGDGTEIRLLVDGNCQPIEPGP